MLRTIPDFILRAVIKAVATLDGARSAAARLGAFTWDDRYAIDLVCQTLPYNHRLAWFRACGPKNGVADVDAAIDAMRATVAYYRYRNGEIPFVDDFHRTHSY